MEYLYAPWRGTYIKCSKQNNAKCPFCAQIAAQDDPTNFILKRFDHTTVFLNIFPYNPGHVLVVPNIHTGKLEDLSAETSTELWRVTCAGATIITQTLKSTGTNIGLNIGGSSAGGSIPDHLHMHIVPRWPGDTAFLPVIADTKPLCEDLLRVFELLKDSFSNLEIK